MNDDLQVVVLDGGHNDGVSPGATWQVTSGERVVARLRVIEVRPAVSAAIVIDGRLKAVARGAPATAVVD